MARAGRLPFDPNALEAFLAVCEARSMAAAAKKLALTQPAISQAIGDLEQKTGVTLFDRSVRPLALTPAGELMRQRASALLPRPARSPPRSTTRRAAVWRSCAPVSSIASRGRSPVPSPRSLRNAPSRFPFNRV